MNQVSTYNHPHHTLSEEYFEGDQMKKSDIVMAILAQRSGTAPPEKRVLKELAIALKHQSTTLENWNRDIDASLTRSIIKHVGSVKGQLSMQGLIADIDILVRRG